jgi:hypothetical protein
MYLKSGLSKGKILYKISWITYETTASWH